MKKLYIIIIFFLPFVSTAQLAVINDPDGYTNVREKPNGESEIICLVKENELFWTDYEEGYDKGDWISVFIPKNKFSQSSIAHVNIVGFIHKSRVRFLEQLNKYTGTELQFSYVTQEFDKNSHVIDLSDGKHVVSIDGQKPWGTDGNYPKNEVAGIDINLYGKNIDVHPSLYSNLFECRNKFNVYKSGNIFIVEQRNSDGAGSYELAWVITTEGIIQRIVGMGL